MFFFFFCQKNNNQKPRWQHIGSGSIPNRDDIDSEMNKTKSSSILEQTIEDERDPDVIPSQYGKIIKIYYLYFFN